jgi:hypothetical protein
VSGREGVHNSITIVLIVGESGILYCDYIFIQFKEKDHEDQNMGYFLEKDLC